jgi:hypothetical protein
MAARLPAVVSDSAGAVPDLIVQGETGFAFPSGDWARMAEHVMTLLRDEELRRRIGAAAQLRSSRYSFEAAGMGVLAALHALGVYDVPSPSPLERLVAPAAADEAAAAASGTPPAVVPRADGAAATSR